MSLEARRKEAERWLKTEAYLKSDAEEGIRLASAILEAVRGIV